MIVDRIASAAAMPSNVYLAAGIPQPLLRDRWVALERRKVQTPARYVGFEIPDKFAIGYGLDYAERYRNLPYVAALVLPDDAPEPH